MDNIRTGRWWEIAEDTNGDLAREVWGVVERISKSDAQQARWKYWLTALSAYLNRPVLGFADETYDDCSLPMHESALVASGVDTFVAKLSSRPVKPYFLTSGAGISARLKARRITNFVSGLMSQVKAVEMMRRVLVDGCVCGRGFGLVSADAQDRPQIERVPPWEVLVDPLDAKYGSPSVAYRISEVSLAATIDEHGATHTQARYMPVGERGAAKASADTMDICTRLDAWRHDESTGKTRHVVCTSAGIIEDTEDDGPMPLISWSYSMAPIGYWPTALVDQILIKQDELARLERKTNRQARLGAAWLIVQEGSTVNIKELTNEDGLMVECSGPAPQYYAPSTLNPETMGLAASKRTEAYDICGVSRVDAQSAKPSGYGNASGTALQQWADIQTERFADKEQRIQQWMCDVIAACFRVLDNRASYAVLSQDMRGGAMLTWQDVRLPETDYVMVPSPVSFFSSSPTARMEQVSEMVEKGMLDKTQALSQLDYPDIKALTNRLNAQIDYIEQQIEAMVERKEPQSPSRWVDLETAGKTVWSAYVEALVNKEDDEVLMLLSQYLAEVEAMSAPVVPPSAQGTTTSTQGVAAYTQEPGAQPQAMGPQGGMV